MTTGTQVCGVVLPQIAICIPRPAGHVLQMASVALFSRRILFIAAWLGQISLARQLGFQRGNASAWKQQKEVWADVDAAPFARIAAKLSSCLALLWMRARMCLPRLCLFDRLRVHLCAVFGRASGRVFYIMRVAVCRMGCMTPGFPVPAPVCVRA